MQVAMLLDRAAAGFMWDPEGAIQNDPSLTTRLVARVVTVTKPEHVELVVQSLGHAVGIVAASAYRGEAPAVDLIAGGWPLQWSQEVLRCLSN